jgi:glutamine amidotransferase
MTSVRRKRPTAAIVDYSLGNVVSVRLALETVGVYGVVTSDPELIVKADALILPGVGAFGDAIEELRARKLVAPIYEYAEGGKPVIGICLGMRLLFSRSFEFGEHEGLGLISGEVVRLPFAGKADAAGQKNRAKVPQVGWNRVRPGSGDEDRAWRNTMLEGLSSGAYMYFMHSYYARPEDPNLVLGETDYGSIRYCSAVCRGNVAALQFHPERSARDGLTIYQNLARFIGSPVDTYLFDDQPPASGYHGLGGQER